MIIIKLIQRPLFYNSVYQGSLRIIKLFQRILPKITVQIKECFHKDNKT